MKERLDILNNVISLDFKDSITMDMLNSKERIGIALKPEVEQSLVQREEEQMQVMPEAQIQPQEHHEAPTLNPDAGYVDGSRIGDYDEGKGWFREGKHGREVEVGDIWVEPMPPQHPYGNPEDVKDGVQQPEKMKYRMCAVIGEVELKTRPEARSRFNFGAFLFAGLEAAREATFLGADISHNIEHIRHPHIGPPTIYNEVHGTGRIYVKPGVDSPQDIASRAFEAGLNQGIHGRGMGR